MAIILYSTSLGGQGLRLCIHFSLWSQISYTDVAGSNNGVVSSMLRKVAAITDWGYPVTFLAIELVAI